MAHHEGNVTKTAVLSKDLIKVDGKLFQCEHTPSRTSYNIFNSSLPLKNQAITIYGPSTNWAVQHLDV